MLRLVTLGRIELTDAHGRPVEAILKRPKRLALLAYLAVGGPGTLRSRDTIVGLFWPDETQARARNSLNQALYVLRQELGKDVVLSVGNDQIALAPGGLWCDAAALRAAEASGDQRSVQAHYRGDFLPGFYLNDAPDFEKWLETERAALRRLASSSAWKLAEEAARAGDVDAAAAAAVRSAELSLREESAVRRAIELLDGLGERARALDLYRGLEADLAEDFGTAPAPETQEVVARVRQREASPEVAEALRPDPAVAVATARPRGAWSGAPESATAPPPPPRSQRLRVWWLALGGVLSVAVLALLVWALTRPTEEAAARSFDDPHLMIEPFDAYTGDDRLTDIAGSITEGLAARLAEVEALDVLLVEAGTPPSADSAALAREAALTDTRATFIVRGRVSREGDRMRAQVFLIDRPSGQVIASATIERVTDDPMSFVDEATQDAERFTRAAVGRELRERDWRASTNDATAWRLLERAERDRREANRLWISGATAAADASFVHADSLLALAIETAPRWLPPRVMRAQVAYDRIWASIMPPTLDRAAALGYLDTGLTHIGSALAIDTADARARELRGLLLYWGVMLDGVPADLSTEVLSQAEAELRSAVTLDERRAEAWSTLSSILYHLGRYDDAYYAAQQAFSNDAYLDKPLETLVKLFNGAFESEDDEAAGRWCDALREQFPGSSAAHQCALTLLAWVEEPGPRSVEAALRILGSTDFDPSHPITAVLELHAGVVLSRAGEADRARNLLERVRASGWNPELAPLEASIHLALGDEETAARVMRAYIDGSPTIRRGILSSRRFDALRQ